MLEENDFQKLKELFATKEDLNNLLEKYATKAVEIFVTKEEIQEVKNDINALREQIQALTLSIDKLVKASENLFEEYISIKAHLDRHEKWIKQIANKLGIKLEY